VVNWFRQYAFGSHAGEWLALAMVILLSFALRMVSLRFGLWFLTRKRDPDESEGDSEKQYWRIHGG
jgi:hypothetical protein